MDIPYFLTSDSEPSDEQLENLMTAVLKDVIERAKKADDIFAEYQAKLLQEVLSKRMNKSDD